MIDPPVDPAEQDLVGSMLQYLDGPSSDELPAPEELVEEQPVVTAQPGLPPQQQTGVAPATPPSTPASLPVEVQPPVPAVAPVAAPVAPGQPQATPPVAPVAPQAPTAQPAAPPQGQPAPQTAAPGQELQTLRQGIEATRETVVKQLAQSYESTFTDQDIEAIQGPDPKTAKQVIATMAGRIHTDIVQNILGIIASQVPVMIGRVIEARAENDSRTNQFYAQYPDLKAHEQVVNSIAGTLRAQHPQMDAQQFVNLVASMARVSLGLQTPVQPQAPVAPQAPLIRQPAFQPAAPTGRGPTAPVSRQGNQWGILSEIIGADDAGGFDIPG